MFYLQGLKFMTSVAVPVFDTKNETVNSTLFLLVFLSLPYTYINIPFMYINNLRMLRNFYDTLSAISRYRGK